MSDVTQILARAKSGDPQAAEVVQMRYFAGMTVAEIADALNLAPRTVDRHGAFARARLKRAIHSSFSEPANPV